MSSMGAKSHGWILAHIQGFALGKAHGKGSWKGGRMERKERGAQDLEVSLFENFTLQWYLTQLDQTYKAPSRFPGWQWGKCCRT